MRKEDLLEAMSDIDEDYIMEAGEMMTNHTNQNRKRVHWGMGAAAALLALSVILPNTNADVALAMSRVPLLGKYFQVVTVRDYQYDEHNKLADVQIPKVDTDAAGTMNQEIQDYTDTLLKSFQADVEAGNDNFRELTISYEVTMDTDTWFTLKIDALEVQASGAGQVKYYHIDKTTGQEVKLSDLFAKDSGYVDRISEEIKRQMREQMAANEGVSYFIAGEDDMADGFDKIQPDEDFYLTDGGDLVIVFDEYQVAPGSMGCPEFTIPGQLVKELK